MVKFSEEEARMRDSAIGTDDGLMVQARCEGRDFGWCCLFASVTSLFPQTSN